jgi:type II secretion system protein N
LKRTALGILYFLVVFLIVLAARLPYEDLLRSRLLRIEREKGIQLTWESGKFSPLGFRLRGVEVISGGRALVQMDEVAVRPGALSGLVVSFRERSEKGKGKGQVRIGFSRTHFRIDDMTLPEALAASLGEGTLSLDGSCMRKTSTGKGRFKANFSRFPLPLAPGEITLEGEFALSMRNVRISFDIRGPVNLSGKGQVDVIVNDRDISYSGISGLLDVKVGPTSLAYAVGGTLRQLRLSPATKGSGGAPNSQ